MHPVELELEFFHLVDERNDLELIEERLTDLFPLRTHLREEGKVVLLAEDVSTAAVDDVVNRDEEEMAKETRGNAVGGRE